MKQASALGVPVVLTDVDNVNDTLKFIRETPNAGVVVVGLPYQLIELNREVSDLRNVATVLKPVKPSDLLRAVNKLAKTSFGEVDWMHESIGEDEDTAEKFTEAAKNASDNAIAASQTAAAATEPEGAGELKGMHVLLVEDNAMNQQVGKCGGGSAHEGGGGG